MITRINHIGIAVNSIEATLKFYQEALGLTLTRSEAEPDQGVLTAFLPVGESDLELLEPLGEDTPVGRFLARRGEGIHHVCFEVEDIDAALAHLKEQGVTLVNREPQTTAWGWRIAFVHPRATHGVLVELVETGSEHR